MSATSLVRGHEIHWGNGEWLFSDTAEPVSRTWKQRPCGHCNTASTPEGHDGCIGRLPGVMNACCGHGESKSTYIQFTDGLILRGFMADKMISLLKKLAIAISILKARGV